MAEFDTALWITLIGMGLVFAGILLLWVVLWALVRFTQDKPPITLLAIEDSIPPETQKPDPKLRAAAIAVALALAQKEQNASISADGVMNAWQIVMRMKQLSRTRFPHEISDKH